MKAKASTTTRSKPPIKAPPPKLTRCQTGKNILHIRAQRVNAIHTMDDFYLEEGKEWMKYCRHAAKCDICGAVEAQRKADQDARFERSRHD
jgi:hypothetical protein